MRAKASGWLAMAVLLGGCGGGARVEEQARRFEPPELPRVIAEDVRFPPAGRKSVTVVDKGLLGLPYLGGGNLASYEKGKQEYRLILIRCRSAGQAGNYIFDIKNQMEAPKFVASYGGYYAENTAAGPLFVFAKGSYIGGVAGLSEAEAVEAGKEFAARIPY
ncbi:MAG: hypothetical protein K7J46_12195 [Bryobacter sp.]|nr:hypothetical protein [Bryobacter sp. CoA8 C33]